MSDNVYLADLNTNPEYNLLDKLERIIEQSGIFDNLQPYDKVAIKLHFGEPGNTAYVRPIFVRKLVSIIKKREAFPFLTDCSTLYNGRRSSAIGHIEAALENGFGYTSVNAPLIIGDGLIGDNCHTALVDFKHFKEVSYGKEIHDADYLLSVAHFKGHEMSGFGGAIKNIGMGAASKKGKLAMHSSACPKTNDDLCEGCGRCLPWCPAKALTMPGNTVKLNSEFCLGCGECIAICPHGAINIVWNESIHNFQEKMVEYTKAIVDDKSGKVGFINFLTDISPECDCYPYNASPLVPDIGVICGTDLVQIDQASVDLVNQAPCNPNSRIAGKPHADNDKFRAAFPNIDWGIQLDYAQELGLGSREYTIKKV